MICHLMLSAHCRTFSVLANFLSPFYHHGRRILVGSEELRQPTSGSPTVTVTMIKFINLGPFIGEMWSHSLLFTATQNLAAMTMVIEKLVKTGRVLQCALSFRYQGAGSRFVSLCYVMLFL